MGSEIKYNYKNDPIIKEVAERLKEKLGDHLKGLILYGSRARGDADVDSDYDILALVDEQNKALKAIISEVENMALDDRDAFVIVMDYTLSEYENRPYAPLFVNVRKEGIPIYG